VGRRRRSGPSGLDRHGGAGIVPRPDRSWLQGPKQTEPAVEVAGAACAVPHETGEASRADARSAGRRPPGQMRTRKDGAIDASMSRLLTLSGIRLKGALRQGIRHLAVNRARRPCSKVGGPKRPPNPKLRRSAVYECSGCPPGSMGWTKTTADMRKVSQGVTPPPGGPGTKTARAASPVWVGRRIAGRPGAKEHCVSDAWTAASPARNGRLRGRRAPGTVMSRQLSVAGADRPRRRCRWPTTFSAAFPTSTETLRTSPGPAGSHATERGMSTSAPPATSSAGRPHPTQD